MIIGNNPPYVFVAIPKTGTRSIYSVLENHFNGHVYIDHHNKIPFLHRWKFSFTVARNPYDRLCSAWWSTCKRGKDKYGYLQAFDERNLPNSLLSFLIISQTENTTVRTIPGSTQSSFLESNKINRVLNFESLEEDFNKLPFVNKKIFIPRANPTTIEDDNNPTKRPSWKNILTKDACEFINEIYKEDFTNLNYKKLNSKLFPNTTL